MTDILSSAVPAIHLPDDAANPVLVSVSRGQIEESRHRGRVAVVGANGRLIASWGDHTALVYPRSANKALQALPLIESGAADAFELSDAELALACSSHQGEAMHTDRVNAWLSRLGLSESDLECGAHAPYHAPTWEAMLREGESFGPRHNNCSGKHSGFLTVARHRGEPTAGYTGYSHPVQQRILGVIEQVTAQDLSSAQWAADGCSIPTIALPLQALAYGMARLADPVDLPDRRAEAARRLVAAWGRHPELISGSGGFDTRFMQAIGSRIVVKSGAEGMCCAVVPEAGIGVAVKIDDGTGRAVGPAMAAVLHRLGLLSDAEWAGLAEIVSPPILNRRDWQVGRIQAAAAF